MHVTTNLSVQFLAFLLLLAWRPSPDLSNISEQVIAVVHEQAVAAHLHEGQQQGSGMAQHIGTRGNSRAQAWRNI